MAIKFTIQGLLIYAVMAEYLIAFVMMLSRKQKAGLGFFFTGFLLGCTALAYRWVHVGHIPLQNLFEAFFNAWCSGVSYFYFLQPHFADRRRRG
jgi:ABC-type transport system involved in cytochrome c biogenesis permease subunit